MVAGRREAEMLGDCIITSWQGGVGVFAPSLPIQNLSLPDCQGTRYWVGSLHEAAQSDVASGGDGEPCRGAPTCGVPHPVALPRVLWGSGWGGPLSSPLQSPSRVVDERQNTRPLC